MSADWKPCPFCGTPPLVRSNDPVLEQHKRYWVYCSGCGLITMAGYKSEKDLWNYWNRRT